MFFALLVLLCIPSIVFTSDITLQFVDDENKTLHTPLSNVVWSLTLKQLVDDLGTEQAIPVHNVSHENFAHLRSLMMKDEHNPIDYTNKTACQLKRIFKEVARQTTCTPQISKPEFLIETNYLDIPKNCLRALTFFYARTIENPTITFNNGKIVFDNLPHELEPSIAGWLSKSTLKSVRPEIIEHQLGDQHCNILAGPIISTCTNDGSFACMYEQIGANDWYHAPSKAYKKVCIVDQKQQTHQIRDIEVKGTMSDASCIISSDKKHLLITDLLNAQHMIIQLYDLEEKGVLKSPDRIITHFIIEKALFNHESKKLTVIAASENDDLAFMTIDPAQKDATPTWDTHKRPDFCKSSKLSWSCVQGYLVGIDADKPTQKALLYTGSELIECSSESSDPLTINATINGKKISIDYGIIRDCAGEAKKDRSYYASEISYIPNMDNAMPRCGFLDYKHVSPFDVRNACVNIIHNSKAMTINLIPRKLNKILHLSNDTLHAGNTSILPYAYAAYCYYNSKETWHKKCKAFLPRTPEISAVFEEKIVVKDELEPNSCPLS